MCSSFDSRGVQVTGELRTACVPGEREKQLRREIREAVVYYLKEDLEGGELYAAERGVVEDELRILIRLILGDR